MIYIKTLPVISETLAGMFPCELYYDGNNDGKMSLYKGEENVKKISGNFLYASLSEKIYKNGKEISGKDIIAEEEGN